MSKICDNCGNMVPDGSDVCPGCGQEQQNNDASLHKVLNELSMALDQIQSGEEDEETSETPAVEAGETIVFRADEVKKKSQKEKSVKKHNEGSSVVAAAMNLSQDEPEEEAPKAEKPRRKPASQSGKKSKKRKKKKSNSTTILGIIIGLILALLVVAGAALLMLYKMGFFELLSDDQLLNTTVSTQESTLSSFEAPEEPVVSEEPSVVEEDPVEERPTVVAPELSIDEPDEPAVNVKKFTITGADDITFSARGETAEIVYVISPEDAMWDIQWESSDETIATVSNLGVITARRGGSCTITGTCGDFEVSVAVYCAFSVPSTVLDMNYDDITLNYEGQKVELKIDYDLTDEQIEATVWETTDESVATVNDEGVVTAVGDGTAVISASIADYTASCIVRCVNVAGNEGVNSDDSEYVINYEDVTLTRKGEYFELTLKSVLGNKVPDFTWKSSNSKVATVDSKGIVTAVADGTCSITTTVGGDDFECIVRVRITG